MLNFLKERLLTIVFITSIVIIIISGVVYTENLRQQQKMAIRFEKTFELQVPTNNEEKDKIQNTIRIKLATLKIKAYGTAVISSTVNTADKIVDIEKIPGVNLKTLEDNKTTKQKEYEEALQTASYFGFSFTEHRTIKQNTWSLLKFIF